MRSFTLTLSIIVLCGAAVAQTPVPGTFNNAPPTSTANSPYIVSTPQVSLGNGITPTVVTNQDTVSVTLPQNTSVNAGTVQANNPSTVNDNSENSTGTVTNDSQQNSAQGTRNVDSIKSSGGDGAPIAGSMSDTSISLGDVARKARNGKQIAKHSITNADVNALNGTAASDSSQPATDTNGMADTAITGPASQQNGMNSAQSSGGTAGAAQPQTSQPSYAQPSNQGPFAPPTSRVNDGTKPNAQQGEGISPRGSARPAQTPSESPNSQDKPQLPRSSSSLPLLGALGALSTLVGIGYLKLR